MADVAADIQATPNDLNLPNDAGLTALHLAASRCCTTLVDFLLDHGANVNRKGTGGETPLHLAAQEGCLNAATSLLAKGAKINARDDERRTPLQRAEQWHKDAMVLFLRQHGATE
ncbi:MAG: ankyrin repeat domain-containing protein [Thermoanaerobaculia bacterium]